MYTVAFYSFKGGVGRTFALVNVATALARAGRKVLIVDFDLEAPGIQTFDLLRPRKPHSGVVEFVSEYLESGATPDVKDFVYETTAVAQEGGRLWVMPAGKGDAAYRRKLAGLHWQALYRDSDGYLMMEDLKAQWRNAFEPDYVFIDSRTGHTDIEGICTRQLPDAVVLLFFPNEQNLSGLREVVSDIRNEGTRSRESSPTLHFVVSNVPELDDEEDILKERIRHFRSALGFHHEVTIHNYPSLSLVNQSIFTIERPKSRLTLEYLQLKEAIIENNMEDREAAIGFLRRRMRPYGIPFEKRKQDFESHLDEIREHHPNDGDLLFLIAMLRKHEGRFDEALQLLDKAIESGNRSGRALLERAAGRSLNGNRDGAMEDIEEALEQTDLVDSDVERAARLIGSMNEGRLSLIPESSALRSLSSSERLSVADALMRYRKGLVIATSILRGLLEDDRLPAKEKGLAKSQLVLCLIGNGNFEDAMAYIAPGDPDLSKLDIDDAFNYAMSVWGKTRKPPKELLNRIIEMHADPKNRVMGANYSQCVALTLAALGQTDEALTLAAEAKALIGRVAEMRFSCWRYRNALPREFVEDCDEIIRFARGETILPTFISNEFESTENGG